MKIDCLNKKLQEELADRNSSWKELINRDGKPIVLNEPYRKINLHINKAWDCFLEDSEGNKYIDVALGAGTHILGHAHFVVVEEFRRQSKQGTLYILPNRYAYEVAGLVSGVVRHFNSFVFCNSGTEATVRAVRIGRAYTGKKKVAMFGGGWHGGNDMLLFEEDYSSNENNPLPIFKSAGIPREIKDMILMLPYNNDAAFDLIKKHKDELAMVMIEPSQGSNPRGDLAQFLHCLREITLKYNILLCFDEIISGFRIGLGGCQQYYGIEADIATYGKTMGGGVSIGMVAGKEEIMEVIEKGREKKSVFMGGTFSANPLAMAIAKAVLQYLIENHKEVYPYLNQNGKYIEDSLNNYCVKNNIPLRIIGIGSMLRIIFTNRFIRSRRERDRYEIGEGLQELFCRYLLIRKGIYVDSNRLFLSMAHKKEQVDKIIQSIIESIEYFSNELKAF